MTPPDLRTRYRHHERGRRGPFSVSYTFTFYSVPARSSRYPSRQHHYQIRRRHLALPISASITSFCSPPPPTFPDQKYCPHETSPPILPHHTEMSRSPPASTSTLKKHHSNLQTPCQPPELLVKDAADARVRSHGRSHLARLAAREEAVRGSGVSRAQGCVAAKGKTDPLLIVMGKKRGWKDGGVPGSLRAGAKAWRR